MNKLSSPPLFLRESTANPHLSDRAETGEANPEDYREKAKLLRGSLFALGRNLLSVNDSTMDLPFRQFRVCLALHRRAASMSEISREIGISLSSLTQVADRLERVGLVERVSQGSDRRVRHLKLTDKGVRLMRSHEESQLERMTKCLQSMSVEETTEVLHALNLLIQSSRPQDIDTADR